MGFWFVFFTWEVGTEEALRLLHEFRAECAQKVEKMGAAYDAIEAYSAMANGDGRKNY